MRNIFLHLSHMIWADVLSFLNDPSLILISKSFLFTIEAIVLLEFLSEGFRTSYKPFIFIFIFNFTNIVVL